MPIGTAPASTRPMTGAEFRSFQGTRPDHERWELVKGVPVGWTAGRLTRLDERVTIPTCGLQCLVSEIYKGTPLTRRRDRP
jgi:hypothetical protein